MKTTVRATRSRPAFALLMVVGCVLLITIALVRISHQSLMLTIESVDASDRLQERWGRVSLERAGTLAAIEMYGAEPPPAGPQMPAHRTPEPERSFPEWNTRYQLAIDLRAQSYRIVIADESAKVNLTTLLRYTEAESVATAVTTLSQGEIRLVPRVLKGDPGQDGQTVRSIESWGELIPIGSADPRSIPLLDLPSVTEKVTIWGDGNVNLLRAPDDVLFELSRVIISDGRSRQWIDEFRRAYPDKTLPMVLQELRLKSQEQATLLSLFSDRSTCVSAWVLGEHKSAGHSLCVATRSPSNMWETETVRYSW